MLAALKLLEDHAPEGTLNAQTYAQTQFPEEDHHWDPNYDQDYQQFEWYQEKLLGGMKEKGIKAMNMSKKSEVLQGPDESPSQLYEHLGELFCLYTPFALEATENQEMINATFVGQAQGDIRQKLQKLEGFAGMNSSQLLEVATKTFVNQDQEARQEADKKMKKKSGPPFSSPC
jgi:hypothetical protein